MSDEALRRHIPWVRRVARRMACRLPLSCAVEADDLLQAGLMAVDAALPRFVEGRGAKVETYLMRCAVGAMHDELRRSDLVSRGDRAAQRARSLAEARLEQRLGRPPRRAEIVAELGWTEEQMRVTDTPPQAVAWDNWIDDTEDPSSRPLDALLERERAARLEAEIARLPDRPREVLRLALAGELALHEIGSIFGVTGARAWQIAHDAAALIGRRLADPDATTAAAPPRRLEFGPGALVG